ncbi:MAG: DUF5060 domain-containing protein [Bacteroidota bacterium]
MKLKQAITGFFILAGGYFTTSAQEFAPSELPSPVVRDGMVKVEAEDHGAQTLAEIRRWERVKQIEFNASPKASGRAYMEIVPDTRVTHDDKLITGENFSNEPGKMAILEYVIDFMKPGRYYAWVRALSNGSEDNGVHIGVDGTWPASGQRIQWCEGKGKWTWSNKQRTKEVHCGVPGNIYLDIKEAGIHRIQFSMREDGFKMDQWILTDDPAFHPEPNVSISSTDPDLPFMDMVKAKHPEATVLKAIDFNFKGGKFYRNNEWLAINPNQHEEATTSTTYDGPSGTFDVILHAVGENDGRSSLTWFINDQQKGFWRPPLSKETFEEGPRYGKVFKNVTLKSGDVIRVDGKIGSKDGQEYSRGRWAGFTLVEKGSGERTLANLVPGREESEVKLSGETKKWHKVTLTMDGPMTSETADYNPFMGYRLNVTFSHAGSGKSYTVPGYYAADGVAGQSGGYSGNKWRVHFSPDETGEWTYDIDFRKSKWAAVSTKPNTGSSAGFMDGMTGKFTISESDKSGRDFRAQGRLQYVGERYLKFAESGKYFLKQGPDAPENFLSYVDFDGTFHNDGHKDNLVKTWSAHMDDWKKGDPTWRNGKGKAMIGALNYLAGKGLNSVSFLTNNIAGDDQNAFPYIDYDTYDRVDVSKMDQWEIVFTHAQELGLFLHFKLLEAENQGLLDNGGVGAFTKFYFREIMARFGHHLALNWNLCEENGEWVKDNRTPPQETEQRLAMTHYFVKHDPYHHHLVIHNGIAFDDLLGPESGLTGPSLQTNRTDFGSIHGRVINLIEKSGKAGQQWAVAVDEPGDAQHSLVPDADDSLHNDARRNALWGTLMAGGWGDEWYFGYAHAHSDLSCQDYRSRDLFWDQTVLAIGFFEKHNIPFWEMNNQNALVGNPDNKNTAYCFAKENALYMVYLNSVETASLDLSGATGTFEVRWFDPLHGGELQRSKVKKVKGGGVVELGKAPKDNPKDWLVLVRRK